MNLLRTHWLASLAAVVMLCGCGDDGPSTESVEGVVTLDSQPVEGVTVGFSPTVAGKGTPATGLTDANGVFKLTAIGGGGPGQGTAVGEYNVSFSKVSKGAGLSFEDTQKMMEDPNYGESGGLSAAPANTDLLPEGYKDPKTSGFTVTVASGDNKGDDFKFDLKSEFVATPK